MKKLIVIAGFAALVASAQAQLSTNPPSSTLDSVTVNHLTALSPNSGLTHWDNTSTLAAYNYVGDGTSIHVGTPDNRLGLNWGASKSVLSSALANLDLKGGSVRIIFTGEDAGWTDSLGYSYTGNPKTVGSSFTLFDRIEANGPNTINTFFGDSADIKLSAGAASTFDFWYSAAGTDGPGPYPSPSPYGGVYSMFNSPSNVRFADTPLWVNTWISATSSYENVATYLVSFEDWNVNNVPNPSLIDYSDAMFALQFFGPDGKPFTPVPEPSTYGLIGAGALLGLAAVRRFKNKK
jgi:hypothetical protein